jgi:hypothetical protein
MFLWEDNTALWEDNTDLWQDNTPRGRLIYIFVGG